MTTTTKTTPSGSAPPPPLRIALLGSGNFASSTHAPAIRSNPSSLRCVAVWSRKYDSAKKLADTFVLDDQGDDCNQCRAYGGQDGLQELLSCDDVDAVVMALPFDAQPRYIRRAFDAGLHVLSEKPVSSDTAGALSLILEYMTKFSSWHWSVGENYRYEPGLVRGSRDVNDGLVGDILHVSLTVNLPVKRDNHNLKTEWRKGPSYSLLLDVFVHSAAHIRMHDDLSVPIRVSALLNKNVEYIPGDDTMTALIEFRPRRGDEAGNKSPLRGTVNFTFAGVDARYELAVTGTEGRVVTERVWGSEAGYRVVRQRVKKGGETTSTHHKFGGVEAELLAFREACCCRITETSDEDIVNKRRSLDRNSPEEAFNDLAFVEALLTSGQRDGEWTKVRRYDDENKSTASSS